MSSNHTTCSISFHAFWGRFFEDEQNNISFFVELFSKVKCPLRMVKDPDESDILVNSFYSKQEKRESKVNILFAPEPNYEKTGWDLILGGLDEVQYPNSINVPLFLSYLYCGKFLPRCISRPVRTTVPQKFCCWIVSNATSVERNTIFHVLNTYKKVDSTGRAFNTTGYLLNCDWGSQGFFDYISQYKFVICGENTKIDQYITEKIFHGYLAHTIPIYWGTDFAKKIFDPNGYVSLDEASDKAYNDLLQRVVELDNDDSKWLSVVNSPVFLQNKMPEELTMESLQIRVADRIDELLKAKGIHVQGTS
jgi:hypothetical protein